MQIGVAVPLFWDNRIFMVLRDNKPGVIDAGLWDIVTETMEPEDNGCFLTGAKRGLQEEILMVPARLHLLGITKAGHGFCVGFPTSEEVRRIRRGPEGSTLAWLAFPKELPPSQRTGGSFRHRYEVYPQAFEKMARGILPAPEELGLRPVPVATPVAI